MKESLKLIIIKPVTTLKNTMFLEKQDMNMYLPNIYNFLKMCKHEKILKENIQKKRIAIGFGL